MNTLKIVAISGSLRKGSFNTALIAAAKEEAPSDVAIEMISIADLPLYNADIENPLPPAVKIFKEAIIAADAVLIASPEYNYSISGVLKNAIDWLSRPYGQNSLAKKPVGIMGASTGGIATGRSQYDLRKVLFGLDTYMVNTPEILVGAAHEKFDDSGRLKDEKTRSKVKELVESLAAWTRKMQTIAV